MISGGDHLEYPIELESDKEIDMEQAFDEAMWEWVLEQGPPQDDDIRWIKGMAFQAGADCMLEASELSMPSQKELDILIPRLTEKYLTEVWRTL